jgi:DNA-binding transcriptional ArsR family regulator
MLYVAREDGGSRLQGRRDDILTSWPSGLQPGVLHFLIRPRFDLLNPSHVAWLIDQCRTLGVTLLVLDTWTALSPGADPMAAKDQAALAAIVVEIAEAIGGAVVVVDHSRKNRAEGEPISSADIYGPLQKWAAAEHIIMLDLTRDKRRIEVFVEGKDGETRRCFLSVTPKGTGGEKFAYSGTIEEIADAQREKGNQNRDAVHRALCDAGTAQAPGDMHAALKARGAGLSLDTVSKHLRALTETGRATVTGRGRGTRYLGITATTVLRDSLGDSELFNGTRS